VATQRICDRCKAVVDDTCPGIVIRRADTWKVVPLEPSVFDFSTNEFRTDLCAACFQALNEWLKNAPRAPEPRRTYDPTAEDCSMCLIQEHCECRCQTCTRANARKASAQGDGDSGQAQDEKRCGACGFPKDAGCITCAEWSR
jgi:hypothetical protein